MKEQDKSPEKQLNEMEIGNFPEKEWISSMVITNIHFRNRATEFLYRNS